MAAPHHSIFTGRTLFLMPNQQHQRSEGKKICSDQTKAESISSTNRRDPTSSHLKIYDTCQLSTSFQDDALVPTDYETPTKTTVRVRVN